MGMLDDVKVDTITYWEYDGPDSVGDPSFGSPEERSVRWEDRNELFYGADGQERQSESIVYDDSNSYNVGDYIYKGSSNQSDPRDQTGYRKVQALQVTRSLDGEDTIYKVFL